MLVPAAAAKTELSMGNCSGLGFGIMPNRVARDSALSFGARTLYGILVGHAGNKDECWPSQKRLAEEMGCAERTVRKYLGELGAAGHVRIEQRGLTKSNVYKLTAGLESAASGPDRHDLAGQDRHDHAGQDRHDLAGHIDEKEQMKINSSTAGAAVSSQTEATEPDIQALQGAGLSRDRAEHHAANNPGLSPVVVEWWRWRIGQSHFHRPVGFLVKILADPEGNEFTRDASGHWHPPRDTQRIQADTQAAARNEAQKRAIEKMEREAVPGLRLGRLGGKAAT